MTKNPLVNALSASAYIALVVAIIHFISQTQSEKTDSFFAPILFLSLLTLSVTVMAMIFFYQPFQLFISGKKKESINLFAKTVGIFAVFTCVVLVLLSAGVI